MKHSIKHNLGSMSSSGRGGYPNEFNRRESELIKLSVCHLRFWKQTKRWSDQFCKRVPQKPSWRRLRSYWRARCWHWTTAA